MRAKGLAMILAGAMLWGTTGPLMEWMLTETGVSVPFLLAIRMAVAGVLLLTSLAVAKKQIFNVWKNRYWAQQLVIFSIFGMLGIQYTFVAAIHASNAVMATLMQFSAPIFIIIFVSVKARKFPPAYQVVGILGTLAGLFLLLTNGSFNNLLVSNEALIWGLLLGLAFTIYTLHPIRLMNEWGVLTVVGWGMFLAGGILSIAGRVWQSDEWNVFAEPKLFGMMAVLIVFGTLAFVLFLGSLKYITPVENSVLSSIEPLTAMIVSVFWLGVMLKGIQMLGAALMLIFVIRLSLGNRQEQVNVKQ
ncbi:EamA/RhaT family transporter [Neobacillus notoginsengisoli]|uniref:EamA/RhaT family transporter n=1 Tax=Neobacillus notoginsengisoli TaxID=1578198 RepID=A0A417YWR4_9BACI|nr:DMT family transporter [Neobacillus notoginsengisoli]RHW42014.1 EamA/RhaT family transporter [Neobacillus notoginsengisoli]